MVPLDNSTCRLLSLDLDTRGVCAEKMGWSLLSNDTHNVPISEDPDRLSIDERDVMDVDALAYSFSVPSGLCSLTMSKVDTIVKGCDVPLDFRTLTLDV